MSKSSQYCAAVLAGTTVQLTSEMLANTTARVITASPLHLRASARHWRRRQYPRTCLHQSHSRMKSVKAYFWILRMIAPVATSQNG
ncbi:hypothetical protein D3C72_1779700 [compost metagenome]